MALLLRRRTRAELEQLLAERLADTAQQRDARCTRRVDPELQPGSTGRCRVRQPNLSDPADPAAPKPRAGTARSTLLW
jgi:hypothetical protein